MHKNAKIYVAGHRGLVGSALVKQLRNSGYQNLILKSRSEVDLSQTDQVAKFFKDEQPEYVFLAAAKVGGINANQSLPADFIHDNLVIQNNVIHHAYQNNVKRLLFLGSSCIYPRDAEQPLKESSLLTGALENTNRPYALAKITGIEMCWSYNRQYGTQFLAVMPTNLFGPNDNYDLNDSHVLPALLRKFHLAKLAASADRLGIQADEQKYGVLPSLYKQQLHEICDLKRPLSVDVWGTGLPRREFMYSEDMASACLHLMNLEDDKFSPLTALDRSGGNAPIVNIGTGEDITIHDLAHLLAEITGYDGEILFDKTKPDGTMRKLLDINLLRSLGWSSESSFKNRLIRLYQNYVD